MTKSEHNLVHLMEECSEVQKVCSKILRFGSDHFDPSDKAKKPNFLKLEDEIAGLISAFNAVSDDLGLVRADEGSYCDKICAASDKTEKMLEISMKLGRVA